MSFDFIGFLKDWFFPISSMAVSIWFAASAKKDADRSELLLVQINQAVQGWQSKIMESATNILDSSPQVIEAKVTLAKMNATQSILEVISNFSDNPNKLSTEEHERTMLALSAHLSMLLDSTKH